MIPVTTNADELETSEDQIVVFPTLGFLDLADETRVHPSSVAEEVGAVDSEEVDNQAPDFTVQVLTEGPLVVDPQTAAPLPARGDGPVNIPEPIPQADVICVTKEAVQDKDAVSLRLKSSSNCEDTRSKIASVLEELCGEDCKLDVFQEDNSNEIIVSGQYVEADAAGMAEKFSNDNIKDKIDLEDAVPRWGKSSKLVLVSLLLTGLLLAALLVAGYYLKTHRKSSKGVRLAESFQVDEENQANTLVSVAPLPQEPLDKPTTNGESPPENGTNPAPSTNGHSTTQIPVADTEM
ncbi:hematopoietic progenitor cell antigen CD34 [Lampris incognitus]|uniref:hematopoietic progenitor cell antigen CD34 n=1 Tax=Lampris incognitus TaxID=2546036 RepID=UPI0024B48507|nr:hematopoietic progenitor cell antigen CD34 [Lampris incognitus]